jgi:Polyketide cyclase / dehydrase and lipid transport
MADRANIRSYHILVDAPADVVFDFVTDLNNLPRWSIHWCKGVRLVDDGAIVTTSSGTDMYFRVFADRDTGVLDWWSGPTKETAQRWPTRVTELADGRSLYQVTAILQGPLPPNIDQWFDDELGMIKRLVEEQAVVAWDGSASD